MQPWDPLGTASSPSSPNQTQACSLGIGVWTGKTGAVSRPQPSPAPLLREASLPHCPLWASFKVRVRWAYVPQNGTHSRQQGQG